MPEVLNVPAGSKEAIGLLNNCRPKLLHKLGEKVLESLPIEEGSTVFSHAEVQQIADGLGEDLVKVNAMITTLIRIFRLLAYHQPKKDVIGADFEQLGLSSDASSALFSLWDSDTGKATLKRLSEITHTGLPRLQDVEWSIVRTIAGSTEATPGPGAHSVVMKLHTDRGPRQVRLTHDQATALLESMNAAQKQIDSLLEH